MFYFWVGNRAGVLECSFLLRASRHEVSTWAVRTLGIVAKVASWDCNYIQALVPSNFRFRDRTRTGTPKKILVWTSQNALIGSTGPLVYFVLGIEFVPFSKTWSGPAGRPFRQWSKTKVLNYIQPYS